MNDLTEKRKKINFHRTNLLIFAHSDLKSKPNCMKINSMTFQEISHLNKMNTVVNLKEEVFSKSHVVKRNSSINHNIITEMLGNLNLEDEEQDKNKKKTSFSFSKECSYEFSTNCVSTCKNKHILSKEICWEAHQKLMKLCNSLKKSKKMTSLPRYSCEDLRIPIDEIGKFIEKNSKKSCVNLIPCEEEEILKSSESTLNEPNSEGFKINLFQCK